MTEFVRPDVPSALLITFIAGDPEMIEKRIPGSHDKIGPRPVTEKDKAEFAAEYRAFKSGRKGPGTPVEEWTDADGKPLLSKEDIYQMHHVGIHTLEHLANLSESLRGGVSQYHMMRRDAAAFLAGKAEQAKTAETARRDEEIRSLTARILSLETKFTEFTNGASHVK